MGRVQVTVATPDWSLSSDTDNPAGAGVVRALVAPLVAGWSTEQLPPVATPDYVTVLLYDAGTTTPATDRWLPMELGTPIGVYIEADNDAATATAQPVTFQGRIVDASAVILPSGGLLFTLICTSRLADWNSTNAPTIPAILNGGGDPAWLDIAYAQVADDAGLPLDLDDGITLLHDALNWGREMVNDNISSGDVLGALALQDIRGENEPVAPGRTHWITYDADPTDPTPTVTPANFVTVPYDPRVLDLAGILNLYNDLAGSGYWIVVDNPDYYTDAGAAAGILLDASQVLQDIGSWITNRASTINTVELQGLFGDNLADVAPIESVRAEHTDLVESSARQSRSLPSPEPLQVGARLITRTILGERSQVESGFGLSQAAVVLGTLTNDQMAAWVDELWPHADVALSPGGPLGRPVAIKAIPDDWKLATGPVAFGRLMSLTVTVEVARKSPDNILPADGRVLLGMGLRAIPALAENGITYDDVGTLSPDIDYVDLDPTITYDTFTLIGL